MALQCVPVSKAAQMLNTYPIKLYRLAAAKELRTVEAKGMTLVPLDEVRRLKREGLRDRRRAEVSP